MQNDREGTYTIRVVDDRSDNNTTYIVRTEVIGDMSGAHIALT